MTPEENSKSLKPSRWKTFKKWAADALAHGWELVSRVDGKHGLYLHLKRPDGIPCGHQQVRQASAMKKGEVSCSRCEAALEGWAAVGKAKGWELLRQVDRARGEFRHNSKPDGTPCGEMKIFFVGNLRKGHAPCDKCGNRALPSLEGARKFSSVEIHARWAAEAASQGWKLARNLGHGRCEFRHLFKPDGTPCGAMLVRQIGNFRYNHVSCEACESYLDIWAADALKHGWELVQKVNDHNVSRDTKTDPPLATKSDPLG